MSGLFRKLKQESGFSLVETVAVSAVLLFVISASYNLLEAGRLMDKQAEDGFEAQNEGRRVLTQVERYLRPAQNMSADDVPILWADSSGKFVDIKSDIDYDGTPEVIRVRLDTLADQIKMHIDYADTSTAEYNFQAAGEEYLDWYGTTATIESKWDETRALASKVVNESQSGPDWPAQNVSTDPNDDFRLFTFYGENFDAPLDTGALGSIWVNHVRGLKLYVLSDIEPADIPSPFGIQSNIHFRNLR